MNPTAGGRHAAHPYQACPGGTVAVGMAAEIDEQIAGVHDLRWYLLRAEDILIERVVSGELTDTEGEVLRAIKHWANTRPGRL